MFARRKISTGRPAHTCKARSPQAYQAADLITSQLEFGFTYAREARRAYQEGELTYGDVAQQIAANSYAAALRFASSLHDGLAPNLLGQIEALEAELGKLVPPANTDFRSIA